MAQEDADVTWVGFIASAWFWLPIGLCLGILLERSLAKAEQRDRTRDAYHRGRHAGLAALSRNYGRMDDGARLLDEITAELEAAECAELNHHHQQRGA